MNTTYKNWFRAMVLLMACVALGACGGTHYQIVRQAAPNPLLNVHAYAVAPVTWNGFTFNGHAESDWLATRTPEQQSNWQNDKTAITERLLRRFDAVKRNDESFVPLMGQPQQGQYVLAINVDRYDHGQFDLTIEVRDAAGQPIDTIQTRRGGGFGLALQLNSLVVFGSDDVVRYLRSRASSGA